MSYMDDEGYVAVSGNAYDEEQADFERDRRRDFWEEAHTFDIGEHFIYVNGGVNGRYEIGKVLRRADDDGYFCFYHSGDTAAKTPRSLMHKLENGYVIESTTLGGERGAAL